MNFYKEGDHSKAVCAHCKKVVPTTFKVRRAGIRDGTVTHSVPDILVSVCDECDRTLAVPQQSFAAVAEIKKKSAKKSVDVRVPRHLLDVLNNSITALGIELTSDMPSILLKLFIADIASSPAMQKRLKKNLQSDLLAGGFKKQCRMSIKVNDSLNDQISELLKTWKINKTELIDATVIEIEKDILNAPESERAQAIRNTLIAVG